MIKVDATCGTCASVIHFLSLTGMVCLMFLICDYDWDYVAQPILDVREWRAD